MYLIMSTFLLDVLQNWMLALRADTIHGLPTPIEMWSRFPMTFR